MRVICRDAVKFLEVSDTALERSRLLADIHSLQPNGCLELLRFDTATWEAWNLGKPELIDDMTLLPSTIEVRRDAWCMCRHTYCSTTEIVVVGHSECLHFVRLAISACLFTSLPHPSCMTDLSAALRATAPVRSVGHARPCSAPLQPLMPLP
jgi:hypothetical protein